MSEEFSPLAESIRVHKYAHPTKNGPESWEQICRRVVSNVMRSVGMTMRDKECKDLVKYMVERKFIPGGRYLAAAGRPFHQTQNCLLLRAQDSREGWSDLYHKASMALMTGAGIGVDYSLIRAEGSKIRRTGGTATGPLALMQSVNEVGRAIVQGGSRRAAIWAGLRWDHPDVQKFVVAKNWPDEVKKMKEKDFSYPAFLDMTNISVQLNDEFFDAYHTDKHPKHSLAQLVYWEVVRQMVSTGEPGFSVDCGRNKNETLRNACTEITSEDDSDICNLGSINLARIDSREEFGKVTDLATKFLLAGTVYSEVPYAKVDQVRTKNRRLGLGIMGIHEWLLKRGRPYGPDLELGEWLDDWKIISNSISAIYSKSWELSQPVKVRCVAPTGSIGILAETTTGIEPIFCVAYKRRYLKHKTWHYQYVVDPTAKRLIDAGTPAESIEDAYSLAEDVERRLEFQSWTQQYVDHGISSTINLPKWGSEHNNSNTLRSFGETLIRYLPNLRGITVYPDGARGGQPLVPVKYQTALKHAGQELVEDVVDVCDLTKGGTCGD